MQFKLKNWGRFGYFPTRVSKLQKPVIRFSFCFFLVWSSKPWMRIKLKSDSLPTLPSRCTTTKNTKYLKEYFANTSQIHWVGLLVFILVCSIFINKHKMIPSTNYKVILTLYWSYLEKCDLLLSFSVVFFKEYFSCIYNRRRIDQI